MNPEIWTAVDRYYEKLLHADDTVLDAALEASVAAGLPDIQVSGTQGKFLNLIARLSGARRILELGTLGGISAIWLARALPEDGRLVTLESEPAHVAVARANLARAGFEPRVEIREGLALETLTSLQRERAEAFDLVFLDADKENYPNYLPALMPLTRPGTLIVADNVVRGGEVVDPESPDARVQGVREFNRLLAADSRIDATVLQTVGVKGYDGFVIGIVGEQVH